MTKVVKKSKIFVCVLMIMLIALSFCFCGCGYEGFDDEITDEENANNPGAYSPYKIAYRLTEYDSADSADYYTITKQYAFLSRYILNTLSGFYGSGYSYDWTKKSDDEEAKYSEYSGTSFVDAIRYSTTFYTYIKEGTTYYKFIFDLSDCWNWTFGANYVVWSTNKNEYSSYAYSSSDFTLDTDNNTITFDVSDSDFENRKDEIEKFYINLKTSYANVYSAYYGFLEMAILDIVLGNTVVDYTDAEHYNLYVNPDGNGMPVVKISGVEYPLISSDNDSIFDESYSYNGKSGLYSVLQAKRQEFNKYSNYIGFTEDDAKEIKEYILTNVIGVKPEDSNYESYANFIETNICNSILLNSSADMSESASNDGSTGDLASSAICSYSKIIWKDVSTSACQPAASGDTFAYIDAHEYSSVITMCLAQDSLCGHYVLFQAENDMSIYCYYRYYDYQTKMLYTSIDSGDMVKINGGTFDVNGECDTNEILGLDTQDAKTVDVFDNNSVISADEARKVSYINRVYKTDTTSYGEACVIDETKATSDFFELVFVIQKSADDGVDDYRFQFALMFTV